MNRIESTTHIPRFKPLLELPKRKMSFPYGIALAIFLFLSTAISPVHAATVSDPLEKMNRVTYQFNRTLDRIVLKPLALTYDRLAPTPVRTGVKNFFSNLDDVRVTFNDLMQLNLSQAGSDFSRLAVNSTVGLGGLINVAGPVFELEKNRQDFGKTLSFWGVGSGPYIVLPIFGPSTLRDSFGVGVDSLIDPIPTLAHVESRNSLAAAKTTDFRARVLKFDDLIMGDEYLFVRGIYLQQREYSINGEYVEVAFDEF